MKLTAIQTKSLMEALTLTREQEIDCTECLDNVAEFAENQIQGAAVPEALQSVEHHLSLCGECREEYQALLAAIKSLSEN